MNLIVERYTKIGLNISQETINNKRVHYDLIIMSNFNLR